MILKLTVDCPTNQAKKWKGVNIHFVGVGIHLPSLLRENGTLEASRSAQLQIGQAYKNPKAPTAYLLLKEVRTSLSST